jgi:methylated-DNA-protein-cysteine methyltransferase-like protein
MKTFRDRVYEVAKNIPEGKVITYGQLAKAAGNAKGARAVGAFMRTNPDLTIVPCHRVVASNGELTGYSAGGVKVKKQKLTSEGVVFIKGRVDLTTSLWSPSN